MKFFFLRQLIFFGALLLIITCIRSTEQATIPPSSEEQDNNSSSGEADTISYSYESEEQIQKRSADDSGNNGMSPHLALPGLPDPAAFLKIIEVLQSVGQQVLPVLLEGINAPAERAFEHLNRNINILKKFRSRLDLFGGIKES